jgi:hypothetical protein
MPENLRSTQIRLPRTCCCLFVFSYLFLAISWAETIVPRILSVYPGVPYVGETAFGSVARRPGGQRASTAVAAAPTEPGPSDSVRQALNTRRPRPSTVLGKSRESNGPLNQGQSAVTSCVRWI